jgi:hypothetical protein
MISANEMVHLKCWSEIVPSVARESFPWKTPKMFISFQTIKTSKTT